MKKEFITSIIIASVVTLIIGFYGGRYYERRAARVRIEQRQAASSDGSAERKSPAGMMPGMGGGMRQR